MRLLPVLKSTDWQGPQSGARVHWWLGTAQEPVAYVTYAWESFEGLVYVTQTEGGGIGEELNEIVGRAFENLGEISSTFEIVEADGSKLLVMAGQPFAAERVLVQQHMREVHEALGAERIVVSVAKRGQLLAGAYDGSAQARATLVNLHREAFVTGGDDRVTDRLIMVDDGAVIDSLAISADGAVRGWLN